MTRNKELCRDHVKGLVNIGNTCFFNAVLQCLMHAPQLAYFIENIGKDERIVTKKSVLTVRGVNVDIPDARILLPHGRFLVTNRFKDLLFAFYNGQELDPRPLFNQICIRHPQFRVEQNDSHELLRCLLDDLREEEQDRRKAGIVEHFGGLHKGNDKRKALLFEGILEIKGKTIIDVLFGGNLLYTIQCSSCGHVSKRLEPFFDLSLALHFLSCETEVEVQSDTSMKSYDGEDYRSRLSDLQEIEDYDYDGDDEKTAVTITRLDRESIDTNCEIQTSERESNVVDRLMDEIASEGSIFQALDDFVAQEILDGYECEKCPKNREMNFPAYKRVRIYSPPTILTLHLNRITQDATGTIDKICGYVQFPRTLDLFKYCSHENQRILPGQRKALYHLYGVICHRGKTYNGGHYFSYVKRRPAVSHYQAFIEMSRQPDLLNRHENRVFTFNVAEFSQLAENYMDDMLEASQWYCIDGSHFNSIRIDCVVIRSLHAFL